jgi:hypothetical protein
MDRQEYDSEKHPLTNNSNVLNQMSASDINSEIINQPNMIDENTNAEFTLSLENKLESNSLNDPVNSTNSKHGILKHTSSSTNDIENSLQDLHLNNYYLNNPHQLDSHSSSFIPNTILPSNSKDQIVNTASVQTVSSPTAPLSNASNSFIPISHTTKTLCSKFVTLIVDEVKFNVDIETIKQYPNTMLGRMFSSTLEPNRPNERGEYEVAYGISSSIFRAILDYYKHGVIECPGNVNIQELKHACDYLLIPFNGNTIRSHNLADLLNE